MLNNDLSSNNWVLQDPRPGVPVKPGSAKVLLMTFEGYTSQDHHCLVKSRGNTIVFDTYGNTDLSPITKEFHGAWVDEIELTSLDSGRVCVHVA